MIDKDKNKPIYKQLVDEILEDIKQGRLNPEDKLPTERELAERLGISRGTVKKAYKELADNGVIEVIQGSGSDIHNNTIMTGNEKRMAAIELLDDLLDTLEDWNFSISEILNLMNISLAKREGGNGGLRVAVIDCNAESLEIFKKQLLYIPDISISAFLVETILLDDNPQALLSSYDLILTTTTHYEQVAEHIGEQKNILVKVAVAPSRDTIVNISRLDPSSSVGIFCRTNKFAQIITDQLAYFLPKLKSVSTHFENTLSVEADGMLLGQYDAIVINPDSILLEQRITDGLLEQYIAKGGKVIPFHYLIDNGSLIYLEERITAVLKEKHLGRDMEQSH